MENYFNYFTEIERYYQTKRDSFTLLSTLDWVLIETWKDQGVPLEIVLKGMDRAFSRAKRKVSSLGYCVNAVAEIVAEQKDLRTGEPTPPDFTPEEVQEYLDQLATQTRNLKAAFPEFESRFDTIADSIQAQDTSDLQAGENALNAPRGETDLDHQDCGRGGGADRSSERGPAESLAISLEDDGRAIGNARATTLETQTHGTLRHPTPQFVLPHLSLFYLKKEFKREDTKNTKRRCIRFFVACRGLVNFDFVNFVAIPEVFRAD